MGKEFVLFDNYDREEDDYVWDDIIHNIDGINTANKIICIADLGLWGGRKSAFKLFNNKLSSALFVGSSCNYIKFWIDGRGNLRSKQSHHDGTNYLLFRELKYNEESKAAKNFMNKIYYNKVTAADISRYTSSLGKYFEKIYNI